MRDVDRKAVQQFSHGQHWRAQVSRFGVLSQQSATQRQRNQKAQGMLQILRGQVVHTGRIRDIQDDDLEERTQAAHVAQRDQVGHRRAREANRRGQAERTRS